MKEDNVIVYRYYYENMNQLMRKSSNARYSLRTMRGIRRLMTIAVKLGDSSKYFLVFEIYSYSLYRKGIINIFKRITKNSIIKFINNYTGEVVITEDSLVDYYKHSKYTFTIEPWKLTLEKTNIFLDAPKLLASNNELYEIIKRAGIKVTAPEET